MLEAVLQRLGDKYEFIKPLGQGGFSKVYLLRHKHLDEEHALKIMDFDNISRRLEEGNPTGRDKEFINVRKRFINEAKLYQKINHPNIARIYDIDMIKEESTDVEIPFIVMQCVKGENLGEVIKKRSPMGIKETIAICEDILDALDVIHKNGIVHRDVKPSNIIIEKSGKAVLIDFGLAKDMYADTRLTSTEMVMGTPLYMSPEQFKDIRGADPPADIYAFGVILYEMLTGTPPYSGTNFEIMYGHLEGSIPDASRNIPGLPIEMDDLIKKAMAKNAEDRYGKVEYYKSELRSISEKIKKQEETRNKKSNPGVDVVRGETVVSRPSKKPPRKTNKTWRIIFAVILAAAASIFLVIDPIDIWKGSRAGQDSTTKVQNDDSAQESAQPQKTPQPRVTEMASLKNGSASESTQPQETPQLLETKTSPYREYIKSATELIEANNYDKATEFLDEAKKIDDNAEVRALFEKIAEKKREIMSNDYKRLNEFLKGDADKNKKIGECRNFLSSHKNTPQSTHTKEMVSDTNKFITQLEKEIKADKQYLGYIDSVKRHIKNGDLKKAHYSLNSARKIKETNEVKYLLAEIEKKQIGNMKADFEKIREFMKGGGDTNVKIMEWRDFLNKHRDIPQNNETDLMKSEADKFIFQLNNFKMTDPSSKKIKDKAKKIYKNDKGFWEADFGDGIIMIYIPAGEFTMGANDGDDDEKPPHKVYLDGYWIGKYEVTFALYDTYCEETGTKKPDAEGWGRGQRPVINVSWHDASAYCGWLSRETGLSFKLPTEAQWEKAARGADKRRYPWGNDFDKSKCNSDESSLNRTIPVGSFPDGASPYGCFDMAGNVWEWCSDFFDDKYYQKSPSKNPQGPDSGPGRVRRGGSWGYRTDGCRASYRARGDPAYCGSLAGFRLALSL